MGWSLNRSTLGCPRSCSKFSSNQWLRRPGWIFHVWVLNCVWCPGCPDRKLTGRKLGISLGFSKKESHPFTTMVCEKAHYLCHALPWGWGRKLSTVEICVLIKPTLAWFNSTRNAMMNQENLFLIFLRKAVLVFWEICHDTLSKLCKTFCLEIAKLFLETSAENLQMLSVAKFSMRKWAKMFSRRNALLFQERSMPCPKWWVQEHHWGGHRS